MSRQGKAKHEIHLKDVIICDLQFNSWNRCSFEHENLSKKVMTPVTCINDYGKYVRADIPVRYCAECEMFFMEWEDYNETLVKKKLVPCCQVFKKEEYISYQKTIGTIGNSDFDSMSMKSLLGSYGYTVEKKECKLWEVQRQRILLMVLENGIYESVGQLAFLLKKLVERGQNRKCMANAVELWKKDLQYLDGLRGRTIRKKSVPRPSTFFVLPKPKTIEEELDSMGIKYIDKRAKRGLFWVIADYNFVGIIKSLGEKYGLYFRFCLEPKATNYIPAWWAR